MKKSIKATISNLIVALIYTVVIVLLIYVIFGNQISVAMALINTISIDKTQKNSNGMLFEILLLFYYPYL